MTKNATEKRKKAKKLGQAKSDKNKVAHKLFLKNPKNVKIDKKQRDHKKSI
mgnify:CR=1 FL=1